MELTETIKQDNVVKVLPYGAEYSDFFIWMVLAGDLGSTNALNWYYNYTPIGSAHDHFSLLQKTTMTEYPTIKID